MAQIHQLAKEYQQHNTLTRKAGLVAKVGAASTRISARLLIESIVGFDLFDF